MIERTEAAIKELEARKAHIETTLAELRVINRASRQKYGVLKGK